MPLLPSPTMGSRAIQDAVRQYHSRPKGPGQCGAVHVQHIAAPVPVVWSLVRRFDRPQAYKQFVRDCTMRAGDGSVGSVREVSLVSGLPAERSMERLDELDDEQHLMSISIIGGDHRLNNYQSTTTLHASESAVGGGTVVLESYVVDVPPENSEADTRLFTDTIIRLNLRSLASITEKMAADN